MFKSLFLLLLFNDIIQVVQDSSKHALVKRRLYVVSHPSPTSPCTTSLTIIPVLL